MTSETSLSILEVLRFIKGGISRKDHLPILQHVCIKGNEIQSSNGIIALSSPIQLAIDCNPLATPFINAIGACESMEAIPAFSLLENGRLRLVAGQFRVSIDCSPEAWPHVLPEGNYVKIGLDTGADIIDTFRLLSPFIAVDASRPWARGILLREGSAFATNNIIIAQHWIGSLFPFDCNVPDECINELLRIKDDPIGVSANERSITFHYHDGRWLKSQLLTTEWPNISPVLDKPCDPVAIPEDFFVGLEYMVPYVDDNRRVFLDGDTIRTHSNDLMGASYTLSESVALRGSYNIDLLRHLAGMAKTIDFALYPAPALWFGPNTEAGYAVTRGAIVGMKSL